MKWAGIDVGKSFHAVCVEGKDEVKVVKAEHLSEYLEEHDVTHVILEPSGVYSTQVIQTCQNLEIKVFMVHTTRFANFRQTQGQASKHDKLDAKLLLAYAKNGGTKFEVDNRWIEARDAWQIWKEYRAIVKMHTAEMNRLRELVYLRNPMLRTKTEILRFAEESGHPFLVRRAQRIRELEEAQKDVEKEMKKFIEEHPWMKEAVDRITQIPCIGIKTAFLIAMRAVNPWNFRRSSFKAFLGVGIISKTSGTSIYSTKRGKSHAELKAFLYQTVQRLVAHRTPGWYDLYIYHLARTGRRRKAKMRIAERLARTILQVWKTGQYIPPNLDNIPTLESLKRLVPKREAQIIGEVIEKRNKMMVHNVPSHSEGGVKDANTLDRFEQNNWPANADHMETCKRIGKAREDCKTKRPQPISLDT